MSKFCPAVIRDAATLTKAYAKGILTPPEALKVRFARIRHTPHVFVRLTEERAKTEAEASLLRWRAGTPLGPLDGVPIAWKDIIDIRGTPTSAGTAYWLNNPPADNDAPVVTRATAQGLVCVGKTNLNELAFNVMGVNPHLGTPRNVFLPEPPRLPGGSSSGAAIAVVAGIVPLAVGTDTGGSVRVPAAYNGLCGYKATSLRHPNQGILPLASNLDSLGIIAHTVADIQALDSILSVMPVRPPLEEVAGLRFLLDESLLNDARVQSAVRTCVLASVKLLEQAGATVERRPCECFQAARKATEEKGWLGAFEAGRHYGFLLDGPESARMDPLTRVRLEMARAMTDENGAWLYDIRKHLLNLVEAELDGALLLSPTTPHVAPTLAEALNGPKEFFRINAASFTFTSPCNFLNMPSLALPCGVDNDNLPLSLQVSAPCGHDARLLSEGATVNLLLRGPRK